MAAAMAPPSKDNKKDAKAIPKGKGAPVADEKNSPANVVVSYPEVDEQQSYLIFDRKYNFKDFEEVGKTAKGGTDGQKGLKEMKENAHNQFLMQKYQIIRAHPYSMVVMCKLNKQEEKPKVEAVEPVEDLNKPTSKGKLRKK